MVPRTIHQIWLGKDPLPEDFAAYVETWRRNHPHWEHRLWTEDNLPAELRRPEVRERIRHPVERADILRLELLWRHGGVYVDVDFECRRPLDPFIGDAEFFTAYLKPKNIVKARERVNNATQMPGHVTDAAHDVSEGVPLGDGSTGVAPSDRAIRTATG